MGPGDEGGRIEIEMSNSAGIFQVDEPRDEAPGHATRAAHRGRGSHRGRARERLVPVFRL
jgi:hypothetical protein